MLNIELAKRNVAPLRILFLGAHCDDIEIGCGGTILKLLADHQQVEVHWIVFCSDPTRAQETTAASALLLQGASKRHVVIKDFRDGFLPFDGVRTKELFEELKEKLSPDLIFTHYREDRHQDHCLISDLTWNTWRDHLILEYEIPKFDGDFGSPNFFVPLNEATIQKKNQIILTSFASQKSKHWFTEDTFLSVARLRGIESGAQHKYAEAFYCRKVLFEP